MEAKYVIWVGLLAVGLSIVLLIVTVRRSARLPEYETREEAMEKRVGELEAALKQAQAKHQREVAELRRDMQAMLQMLTEKQREVSDLKDRIHQLESARPVKERRQRKPVLAVGIGADGMLEEDLAALRGVPGLHLAALHNVSMADLEALIERHRALGAPVRFLHLSLHADHQGAAFADGIADGLWLSRNLSDVEVLVLAGCKGDRLGDLLAVVPYPITMRAEIENRDASIFTRAFWTEIGRQMAAGDGVDVDAALDEALRRSPRVVSEMIEPHW